MVNNDARSVRIGQEIRCIFDNLHKYFWSLWENIPLDVNIDNNRLYASFINQFTVFILILFFFFNQSFQTKKVWKTQLIFEVYENRLKIGIVLKIDHAWNCTWKENAWNLRHRVEL